MRREIIAFFGLGLYVIAGCGGGGGLGTGLTGSSTGSTTGASTGSMTGGTTGGLPVDPGPPPNLFVSAPIRDRAGLHLFERETPDTFDDQLKLSRQDLGLRWVRFDFAWDPYMKRQTDGTLCTVGSDYARESLDRFRALRQQGAIPIIVVSTGHPTVNDTKLTWDGTNYAMGWPITSEGRLRYSEFVVDVARKLTAIDPSRQFVLQLGNELSNNVNWSDPARRQGYVTLVKETSTAVRAAGLSVNLVAGSFSTNPGDQGRPGGWPAENIQFLKAAGLDAYVDGYTIHLYKSTQGSPGFYYATEELLPRAIQARTAAGAKALLVTESGYHSAGFTQNQGSKGIGAMLTGLMAGADVVIHYQAFDRRLTEDLTDPLELSYGLRTVDGADKPSFRDFKGFFDALGDDRLVSYRALSGNRFEIATTGSQGNRFIRWSAGNDGGSNSFPSLPNVFN